MHMEEGIGRGGYKVLAWVFLLLGVLGLVTTLYAFLQADEGAGPGGLFDWLGFGLTFVALATLFALTLVMLRDGPAPTPPPATATMAFHAAPAPPPVPSALETGPEVAIPIPPPQAPVVVQPNRNLRMDTKGWPRRQPPSGLTVGEKRQLQRKAVEMLSTGRSEAVVELDPAPIGPPGRPPRRTAPADETDEDEEQAGRGRNDMAVRVEAPTRIARVAGQDDDPSWVPEGTQRGKCLGCGTLLYAPQERPLHLKCPKCGKVTLLR